MKKHINFKDSCQVWRILISPIDQLIIETRDTDKKEAYFSCYDLGNSKKVFKSYQLDEKYWLGIEDLYDDLILFHRFTKPDMPGHKSIIAFDIKSRQVIWENNDYSFLFLYDEKIYCFTQGFEGRRFYTIDPLTGNLIDDLGDDAYAINEIKYKADDAKDFSSFMFPETFSSLNNSIPALAEIISKHTGVNNITGEVEFVEKNSKVFMNFHHEITTGVLENKFIVWDIAKDKIVMNELLNSAVNSYVPDSFFIYKNFLILLKEKSEVLVYKLD